MSRKKSIHLGQGVRVEMFYEQLKKKLVEEGFLYPKNMDILRKWFPEEVAEEERQRKERFEHQRWLNMETGSGADSLRGDYFSNRDLLLRAAALPANPKASDSYRVTDFSGWVYQLQGIPSDWTALEAGKEAEREVERARKRRRQLLRSLRPLEINGWRLIYSDLAEEFARRLKISLLEVNGKPLYGSPDYVFLHEESGELRILEIKCTDAKLRANGWPNLRAQLWAYGHIDEFMQGTQASGIVLVGEIWDRHGDELRQTIRWEMGDSEFFGENKRLFDLWCERA